MSEIGVDLIELADAAVIDGLRSDVDQLVRLLDAAQKLTNAVVHERDRLQDRVGELEARKPTVIDIGVRCDGCGHVVGLVGSGNDHPSFNLTLVMDNVARGLGWTRIGDKHHCPVCKGK